jgi:hypothetical protein
MLKSKIQILKGKKTSLQQSRLEMQITLSNSDGRRKYFQFFQRVLCQDNLAMCCRCRGIVQEQGNYRFVHLLSFVFVNVFPNKNFSNHFERSQRLVSNETRQYVTRTPSAGTPTRTARTGDHCRSPNRNVQNFGENGELLSYFENFIEELNSSDNSEVFDMPPAQQSTSTYGDVGPENQVWEPKTSEQVAQEILDDASKKPGKPKPKGEQTTRKGAPELLEDAANTPGKPKPKGTISVIKASTYVKFAIFFLEQTKVYHMRRHIMKSLTTHITKNSKAVSEHPKNQKTKKSKTKKN